MPYFLYNAYWNVHSSKAQSRPTHQLILQRSDNVAWILCEYWCPLLNFNQMTTFRQCFLNAAVNVEFRTNDNFQAMLCECWCPTLKCDRTKTFTNCCHNVVAMLNFNVATMLYHNWEGTLFSMLLHCDNVAGTPQESEIEFSIFQIKLKMIISIHFNWKNDNTISWSE